MNWLDILIAVILFFSTFWSFRQGFILELFYFLALVGGLFFSFLFYPYLSPFLESLLGGADIGATVAFFFSFVLFGGGLVLLGLFIHKFIYLIRLGFLDRLLGALFGFLKAGLGIAVVLVMIVAIEGKPAPDYLDDSYFARPIVYISTGTMNKIPLVFDEFKEDYGKRAEEWLRSFENLDG
ncbi:MAG: CvpA family protein [bacterium]